MGCCICSKMSNDLLAIIFMHIWKPEVHIIKCNVRMTTSGCCTQGWLGSKDTILHSGEGPIQDIKWSGNLIAWANDLGVKVYDTTVHQRMAYVERPKSR